MYVYVCMYVCTYVGSMVRSAQAPETPPSQRCVCRPLAGGGRGGGPNEPLKLCMYVCKRGVTSIHAHDCQEGRGLHAFLSKELPQEHVAFIGFAAGGWVDMLRWTGVCVKPAPPTQQDYGDDALWWTHYVVL